MPDLIALQSVLATFRPSGLPPGVLLHLPAILFVVCLGACVGSFVNVVVYRLPAGMSVIHPPSRCPTCGACLRFFRENLPVLGWFMIRGRCRYCGARVSAQYMIIELLMALLFVGLYAVLFMSDRSTPWWGDVGGPWWSRNTFFRVWPAYIAFSCLIAGLVAMTLIDARTFTIPLQIPLFVTVTAFIAWPLQALLPHKTPSQTWPIPSALDGQWLLTAGGGMLGVLIGVALLRFGALRYSFMDYEEYLKEGETIAEYPHARREMGRELLFLLPCLVGLIAGFLLGRPLADAVPPLALQALGGSVLGYLSGGALIWGVRILGTLGFGREAMGLGDVHLLAAVGAVLGWFDPIPIFFIAPFFGLLWVVLALLISSVFRTERRHLPYGPHLAIATLVVILGRPGLDALLGRILPGVPLPAPGLLIAQEKPGPAAEVALPGPVRQDH